MLTMVDIEFIRKKHLIESWSIRQLSRQLGLSRQTVRKALVTTTPPRYTLRQPRPSPIIDPVRPLIVSWLRADEQAPPKQRHTAMRICKRSPTQVGWVAVMELRFPGVQLRPQPPRSRAAAVLAAGRWLPL
jgi:hypothetical protein